MADLKPRAALQPRSLFSLQVVGACALNAAKDAVAFIVTGMDEAANAYRSSVCVCSLAGEARVITDGSARDQAPQWSADGKELFFLSDRGGRTQLWRVGAQGGAPKPLPELPGNLNEFSISSNGRYIAAIAVPGSNREKVLQRGWRRLTRLRFRADGPGYFDDLPLVWLVDLASQTTRQLTDGSGFVAGLAWSCRGTSLAFTGDHGSDADSLWRRELWTAQLDDGCTPRRVVTLQSVLEAPAWSPGGSRIAFCGVAEPKGAAGFRNLQCFVTDVDGSNLRSLTAGEEWTCGNFVLTDVGAAGSINAPFWLSDRKIAVLGSQRGAARVFLLEEGEPAQALTPAESSVTAFAAIDEATIVHCSSGPLSPPELYLTREGQTRQLTCEGWPGQRGPAPGDQAARSLTHFVVRSADTDIHAWHLGGEGSTPRPCILYIHGGPHFAYGNAFVFHFLMLAAAGYDVLYCNPRGSQSYGESFARALAGNFAQPAYDDCMTVLEEAIRRFAIDPQRLGIAGGSYGGYLVLWTIGRTRRFKAAVALRPASNLTSLWGTSEVGRMLAEDFGGRPMDGCLVYERDSPLSSADAIETPLLIVYGDQDYRTPAEQAEQMFTALRARAACVEAVHFLGADHNLSRTGPPQLRVAHEEAILEWFDRFLK